MHLNTGATPGGAPARPGRPELLAPAGDWDCAKAAVENGADAIYFGIDRFNARIRSRNFRLEDLPALMAYLHRRGVRGYLAFNTLVFPAELADAEGVVRAAAAAGVDALIVQDVGICRLVQRISPDFPIHASTQMTITSEAGVDFARGLGCSLAVLARECSIDEIRRIQEAQGAPISGDGRAPARDGTGTEARAFAAPPAEGFTGTVAAAPPAATPPPLPLEVFVHGALCVAYSGQCLTSEALGGRSANRGECAQACRMPYGLVVDGRDLDLGDRRYLLSPQDLAGLPIVPELVRAGVASLKIEGRLKAPSYVASIVRVYREALDRACAEDADLRAAPPRRGADPGDEIAALEPDARYELEMAFSRGLFTGWLRGIDNRRLVHGRFGKKRGVLLGEVLDVRRERVALRLLAPVKPGDGLVFDAGDPEAREEGGRVYEVSEDGDRVWLAFGHGAIDWPRVRRGDKIWKTDDPELGRRLRRTWEGEKIRFRRPVDAVVEGRAGEPLALTLRDDAGRAIRGVSEIALERAERQPLSSEVLRAQVGRLGENGLALRGLENRLDGAVMLPLAELNRLRREVAGLLDEARTRPPRWTLLPGPAPTLPDIRIRRAGTGGDAATTAAMAQDREDHALRAAIGGSVQAGDAGEPELAILVRNLPQLEEAARIGVDLLYCELEDPKRYRDAVRLWRELRPGAEIWLAPPRIHKPGEEWILRHVRAAEGDGILARNPDHIRFFDRERRIGDYSLNVANALAAEHYVAACGLERVTASCDLDARQLEELLDSAPPAWFEATIHQHMPMFHMEHCVFCAFLTDARDFRDCGRPCETREVRLSDHTGARHLVKADAGCRNTVFNARAQTGAEVVGRLLARGLRRFRVEFLDEPPHGMEKLVGRYRQLLRGEVGGEALWREFRLHNQLGVTRGTLSETRQASATPR